MFVKVIFLFIISVHAGPIIKRSDLGPTSLIRSSSSMHNKYSSTSRINESLQPIHEPMSLVTYNNDDDLPYQMNMEPSLDYRSFYTVGDEVQRRSKNNLKYGVTNIGSRQHRYGEGTWNPDPDQIHQQQGKSNNKPMPRRKEKRLTGMENQGHLIDPVPPPSSTDKENDIVAVDNHGQLHTLALPMTILPVTN